jgi:hypothetical protein
MGAEKPFPAANQSLFYRDNASFENLVDTSNGGSNKFFHVAEALPLRPNLAGGSKPPNAKASGYKVAKVSGMKKLMGTSENAHFS